MSNQLFSDNILHRFGRYIIDEICNENLAYLSDNQMQGEDI